LRPLGLIIRTKLINRKFPFEEDIPPVSTTTTDFKYLDDSLIGLMNKVKEAFDKEREFTSNASHELMTPISILQNKIENLMLDHEMDESAQEKIMGIMNTLNRLKKIVLSLLMISRIENDQYSRADKVRPQVLIEEVIKELEDRIEARGIKLTLSVSRHIVLQNVNRDLLFQLFYNLINNAIRYNKEGGAIGISDHLNQDKSYIINITDTGIGMKENDLESIFDRFKKTSRMEGEGYGLGLSIVKSIVQYHSIRIAVKSEYGKGSEFSIIFLSGSMLSK